MVRLIGACIVSFIAGMWLAGEVLMHQYQQIDRARREREQQ